MGSLASKELESLFNGSVVQTDKLIWAAKVTPAMAHDLLDRSIDVKNRTLAQGHVAYLRFLMQSNQWVFPAPALVVDTAGRVYNGQHRLTSQIQAKQTITYVFMLGDEKAMLAFDNNKARTLNDRLRMNGYPDANALAAASRVAAWIQLTGGVPKRMDDRPELKSPIFMTEYVDRYQKQLMSSIRLSTEAGYHSNGVVTGSVAAGLHFSVCRREDLSVADKIIYDLHESDNALWVTTRRSLKRAAQKRLRDRLRREDSVRILLVAYDRFINKSKNVDLIDPDEDVRPILKGQFR